MRSISDHPWCLLLAMLVLVGAGLAPGLGLAQQVSREQLEMLQQLSPEEREQVARQLGISEPSARRDLPEFPPNMAPAGPEEPEQVLEEPRIAAGDTLIVSFDIPEVVAEDPDALADVERRLGDWPELGRLKGAASYEIDERGYLRFPGVASVFVAGLNTEEAALRLQAEAALSVFEAAVVLLPLEQTGTAALKPFGYDLFSGVPTTFAPATDVPVPVDYVIGPGDEIRIVLYGNEAAEYAFPVERDGTVILPRIGPVAVAGLSFEEMKNLLIELIAEQRIGVRASITMGVLRSIRIFVVGDVNRPGSYTVSALSTATNALFASGGVSDVGPVRRIELKRGGRADRPATGTCRRDRGLAPANRAQAAGADGRGAGSVRLPAPGRQQRGRSFTAG